MRVEDVYSKGGRAEMVAAFLNQEEGIHGLEIARDLTLDTASDLLIKTVSFGDFLAEERKKARIQAYNSKKAYRQQKLVGLKQADGKDAKTRESEADHFAEAQQDAYETDDIQADFIQDLMKNNHDKSEALRTIISAKKSQYEIEHRTG
jgi:hypothetical protein